jgi:hypothetical protein
MSSAAAVGSPTYIVDGEIRYGERPFSIVEWTTQFVNAVVFFFTSMLPGESSQQQLAAYNSSRARKYGGSSGSRGTGGAAGSGGAGRDVPRRSNVQTFGPAAQTGCAGGG